MPPQTKKGARDGFSAGVKQILAHRAGFRCSNPSCRALTVGPSMESIEALTNVGVAAHITAASPGGARYDDRLTSDMRGSVSNGIWLCQLHAKEIDDDAATYTTEKLKSWKNHAEEDARAMIGRPISEQSLEVSMEVAIHRASDNSLIVTGLTNLPEGSRLMIDLLQPSSNHVLGQERSVVIKGMFAATGFSNEGGLHPNAWFSVLVVAYFNDAWGQLDSVIEITGKEGEHLKGMLVAPQYPEFPDEGKTIHARFDCVAPPLIGTQPPGTTEIESAKELVKNKVFIWNNTPSAKSVGKSIEMFFGHEWSNLRSRGDWQAHPLPDGSVIVSRPFFSGNKPEVAKWHVVPASGEVRVWNLNARHLSYVSPSRPRHGRA